MKIKKGDKVKIITGKDKGKTGKVLQVFVSRNKASVEGRNLLIKHMRPRRQNEGGQRIEFPSPMDLSNLKIVCPKCNQPAKIGYKTVKGDKIKTKKHRECKKCKQAID